MTAGSCDFEVEWRARVEVYGPLRLSRASVTGFSYRAREGLRGQPTSTRATFDFVPEGLFES